MALADLLSPWAGITYRHVPSRAEANVLDFRFAGTGADNRWNEPGLPTLYLAGDERVAVAEWGRHLTIQRNPALAPLVQERRLFRLSIALNQVLDLRRVETWNALSLTDAPQCFLDIEVARATALFIRRTTPRPSDHRAVSGISRRSRPLDTGRLPRQMRGRSILDRPGRTLRSPQVRLISSYGIRVNNCYAASAPPWTEVRAE